MKIARKMKRENLLRFVESPAERGRDYRFFKGEGSIQIDDAGTIGKWL